MFITASEIDFIIYMALKMFIININVDRRNAI